MKTFLAFLISFLTLSALSADINETNIPIAVLPAISTNDYVRILTNSSPNIAAAKTRLAKFGDLLSFVSPQLWNNVPSAPVQEARLIDTNTVIRLTVPVNDYDTGSRFEFYPNSMANFGIGQSIEFKDIGYPCLWTEGLAVLNSTRGTNSSLSMYGRLSSSGLFGIYGNTLSGQTNIPNTESSVSVIGENYNYSSLGVGVTGVSAQKSSPIRLTYSTNVGVAGLAYKERDLFTNTLVGGFFEVNSYQFPTQIKDPIFQSAAILLDSTVTGLPLIVARTNNGTTVFKVSSSGEMYSRATNFILGCTDGIGSWYVGILPDGTITTRTNTSP